MLHLYIRKSIAPLCLLLLTISITGCGVSRQNVSIVDFIRQNTSRPPHRAVALAEDSGERWCGGQSWSAPTEQEAINVALAKCEEARLRDGVRNPCQLYSVNGRDPLNKPEPVAPKTPETSSLRPKQKQLLPPAPSAKNILLTGTGFAVTDDGFILTANHLIEDAGAVTVRLADGVALKAKVIKASHNIDLALLKIDSRTPDYLPITSTQTGVAPGDRVFTFGFPVVSVLGVEPKFSDGAVSSLSGPGGEITFLQITVPIQPGNSGGPLISEQGDVVGIITASAAIMPFIKATGTLPQNVNWAVNANFAVPLVPQVATKRQLPIKRKDIIDRARKSVVLIEVSKADPG
jgi:S1-C subfamily serine protease